MTDFKGIILAGGNATRLSPVTKVINKHLLPIYNKPMIYYPLASLMLAGIKEILLITSKRDLEAYQNLLGDGSQIGISISYKVQEKANGIADGLILAEEFIGNSNICLILGDNIFYGENFRNEMREAKTLIDSNCSAVVFGYHVKDPERYGVIEFDNKKNVISIEEKPKHPKSSFAVAGLYFYNNQAIEIAKNLSPSARGELEITDVNNEYLKRNQLKVMILNQGFAWLDTGTHDSLLQASNFIQTIEQRQNLMIGSIEEIAYHNGYINKEQLTKLANEMKNTLYGQNLLSFAEEVK